jgi:hypothetical protein
LAPQFGCNRIDAFVDGTNCYVFAVVAVSGSEYKLAFVVLGARLTEIDDFAVVDFEGGKDFLLDFEVIEKGPLLRGFLELVDG